MRSTMILAVIVSLPYFAMSQKKDKAPAKPDEQITVKKEFDEQGRLLRYDSTYTFQWFSDTTLNFDQFKGWRDFFGPDFDFPGDQFSRFFGDSAFQGTPFEHFFGFGFDFPSVGPGHNFPQWGDTSVFKGFSFRHDTTFFWGPDSSFLLPPGFIMPDTRSLNDLLKQFDNENRPPFDLFSMPRQKTLPERFFDKEQQEEWESIMERHRLEMENFRRKWEDKQRQRIY